MRSRRPLRPPQLCRPAERNTDEKETQTEEETEPKRERQPATDRATVRSGVTTVAAVRGRCGGGGGGGRLPVQNPARVDAQPRHDPDQHEHGERDVAQHVQLQVFEHLGALRTDGRGGESGRRTPPSARTNNSDSVSRNRLQIRQCGIQGV